MTWTLRLRDLILAGGAVAAAACSSSGATPSADAGPTDGGPLEAGPVDAAQENTDQCCNANPDPCCPSQYCGQPVSPVCACKLDGGAWDLTDGGHCAARSDAGPDDAGPDDAGDGDGASMADGHD